MVNRTIIRRQPDERKEKGRPEGNVEGRVELHDEHQEWLGPRMERITAIRLHCAPRIARFLALESVNRKDIRYKVALRSHVAQLGRYGSQQRRMRQESGSRQTRG